MPGPTILAAAAVTAFVMTTTAPYTPLVPPSSKEFCSKNQCVVLTEEQVAEVFRAGALYGAKRTIDRMQPSCLKDET